MKRKFCNYKDIVKKTKYFICDHSDSDSCPAKQGVKQCSHYGIHTAVVHPLGFYICRDQLNLLCVNSEGAETFCKCLEVKHV